MFTKNSPYAWQYPVRISADKYGDNLVVFFHETQKRIKMHLDLPQIFAPPEQSTKS